MRTSWLGILVCLAASAPMLTRPALAQPAPARPAPAPVTAAPEPAAAAPAPSTSAAPDAIDVYFAPGSAAIRAQDLAQLDHAARLYRDGKPILMTVAAGTDSSGSPQTNIRLSQQRADAVYRALVARGIPAERFQILAKGATDPADPSNPQDGRNRRAEITWK